MVMRVSEAVSRPGLRIRKSHGTDNFPSERLAAHANLGFRHDRAIHEADFQQAFAVVQSLPW